jgi:hypothetical protein
MTIRKIFPALAILAGALSLDALAAEPPQKPKALVIAQLMDEESGENDRRFYIQYVRAYGYCRKTGKDCGRVVDLVATLMARGLCVDSLSPLKVAPCDPDPCQMQSTSTAQILCAQARTP